MLTLFYERVSTDRQSESGLGLDAQRRRNEKMAEMLDRREQRSWQTYTDEGVSASVSFRARPQAGHLMTAIAANTVGRTDPETDIAIIAYSLDRLFRDVDDGRAMMKWFDDHDVKVYLSNEGGNAIDASSAMGRFLITIRLAQGELERGLTSERTKAALGALQARGGKVGEPPYGWRSAGEGTARHEPNPHEQEVILYMESLQNECSLREIARCATERGYRTRDGKEFTHVQVGRILRRPNPQAPPAAAEEE